MTDLDYAKVIGRFGLTVGDTGTDPDDDPDTVWCTEGRVIITPLNTFVKVAGGSPVPWTGGNAQIECAIDANGYLTYTAPGGTTKQFVEVVDLTSSKVNPQITTGATHRVTFADVKSGTTPVAFPTFTCRLTAAGDGVSGAGINDLTIVAPIVPGEALPITRGPQGVSIESLAVNGLGELEVQLDDGTTVNAGDLPVGPGGSDAGVAGYLGTPASASRAALDEAAADLLDIPTSALAIKTSASTAQAAIVRKYGKPDPSRAFLQSELERINLAGGRVGVLGDSLTEGNANGGHPWYEEWETLYPDITFVNYGHGGKTTKDFIDTYMAGILADTDCDLYIVALGCNDVRYKNRTDGTQGATTAAAVATNLTSIVGSLSPVGSVVVVNPWMTTIKDYAQDITTAAKEKAFADYDAAAQAAMTALGVPYIQTNALMMDSYRDAARALSWSDGVHPTAAYVKQYARLVLHGRAPRGEVLPLPVKATKAFLYRLEILGKVPTTTDAFERVYLRSLLQDPATVGESYSTGNRDTFADASVLFAAYDNTKALVNLEGDWPLNIMWSRDVRLQYLVQLPNGMARGIGDYRIWESTDPEAIGQPDHPSWRMLFNGRRGRANGKGAQRLLYAARRNEERFFYKWVLSSAYSGDASIKVTSLSFPSNTGADGLSAYRTSAAQSEDQVQMFNQNSISTDFGTSGWIIGAFNSSVPTFNIAFGATNRADGWSLYQSSDPAAFDDESHASWKKIRSGSFGGSASPGNVSTRADGVRFPAYATASRPSAASVEAGAAYWDTTIHRPGWSDGSSTWYDSAGSAM